MVSALDGAAELGRHGLFAIADAEQREAGLVNVLGREWRVLVEHGSGSARENDRLGLERAQRFFGLLKRRYLAINLLLAHAPGDQLRDLRAEIDDENLVVGCHSGFYGKALALSRIMIESLRLRTAAATG